MVAHPGEPVVDLAHLAGFSDGDPALERELADLYLSTAEGYVLGLGQAPDPESWRKTAHALKGASANLGARRVAALALRAEKAAPDPTVLADLGEALADVRAFFDSRHPPRARGVSGSRAT